MNRIKASERAYATLKPLTTRHLGRPEYRRRAHKEKNAASAPNDASWYAYSAVSQRRTYNAVTDVRTSTVNAFPKSGTKSPACFY